MTNDDEPKPDTIMLPAERASSIKEVEMLEAFAAVAERRAIAMDKIIHYALKRTHPQDWIDMSGKPYLQESGALRIANHFGISGGKPEGPMFEFESDGHYTVMFKNTYTLSFAGITNQMGSVGIRSSQDPFFTRRYEGDKQYDLDAADVDRQSVIQSALANCNANGVKDLLGLNNLTWDQVELFTGFKREHCGVVPFKGAGRGKSAEHDVTLIPFKDHKGKSISDPSVPTADLERYVGYFKRDLADKDKKDYHERTRKQLEAYEKEIDTRTKEAGEAKAKTHQKAADLAKGDQPTFEQLRDLLKSSKTYELLEDLWNSVKTDAKNLESQDQTRLKDLYEERRKQLV